jgi:hypothetical protein
MKFDVFISYSHTDKKAADAACAVLEAAGIRCWIAPRDVGPGEYATNIVRAIGECRVFLLMFSSETNLSTQVRKEIERAVSKERMIVPLRIEEVTPGESLEYYLSDVHWLDAFPPPLESHLHRLADELKVVLDPTAARPRPSAGPPPPPRPKVVLGWPVKIGAGLAAVVAVAALLWIFLPRPLPLPPNPASPGPITTVALPVTTNPLRAQSSRSTWEGTYAYPTNDRPPVVFEMTLEVLDSRVSGVVKEPATFGTGSSPYLYANIAGRIDGSRISFTKTYDGTNQQSHPVEYDGVISADGASISGKYVVGDGPANTGTFAVKLKP